MVFKGIGLPKRGKGERVRGKGKDKELFPTRDFLAFVGEGVKGKGERNKISPFPLFPLPFPPFPFFMNCDFEKVPNCFTGVQPQLCIEFV